MVFKFADNQTVDSLDKVPEQFRSAYEENPDGGFRLSDGAKWAATAIDSLNGSLSNARNENNRVVDSNKELTTKMAAFTALGEDPDALANHIKELESAATKGGQNKVDLQKLKEEAQANLDKVKAESEAKLETERNAMRMTAKDSEINAAFLKHGVKSDMGDVLRSFVRDRIEVIIEEGKYVTRIKGSDGNYRGDGVGGFMGADALIKEMRGQEEFGGFFKGDGQSGSSMNPSSGGTGGGGTRQSGDGGAGRSSMDKITAGLKKRGMATG